MSRDLGPTQRLLLAWAGRYRGARVAYLAEDLGVTERRARKAVEALVDRELIVVVNDPWLRDRRIWTPAAHRYWKRAQQQADSERAKALHHPPIRAGRSGEAAR